MKDLQPHKWCALAKVHVYVRVKHWVGWLWKGNIDWYNKDLDCNKLYEDMRPMELYACKPIWYLLFACITHLDNDCDRIIVAEAHSQNDGPTWEKTKRYHIESLRSWKVFSSIITTLKGSTQWVVDGCLWGNEINFGNVSQYKARLVVETSPNVQALIMKRCIPMWWI